MLLHLYLFALITGTLLTLHAFITVCCVWNTKTQSDIKHSWIRIRKLNSNLFICDPSILSLFLSLFSQYDVCVITFSWWELRTPSREFHAHVQSIALLLIIARQIFCLSDRKADYGEFNKYSRGGNSLARTNNNQTIKTMERDRLGQWGNGDNVIPSKTSGLERIRNPNLNKVGSHPTFSSLYYSAQWEQTRSIFV